MIQLDKREAFPFSSNPFGLVYENAITENKEVAGQRQGGRSAQVEVPETADKPLVDGPFPGVVDARVDAAERKTLLCKTLPHRFVVDGAEVAHVERHGVAHDTPLHEVGAVLLDQRLGEGCERKVRTAEKVRETVERTCIIARRP